MNLKMYFHCDNLTNQYSRNHHHHRPLTSVFQGALRLRQRHHFGLALGVDRGEGQGLCHVEGAVVPQVDAQVVGVGGRQEFVGRGDGDARGRGVQLENVNQTRKEYRSLKLESTAAT